MADIRLSLNIEKNFKLNTIAYRLVLLGNTMAGLLRNLVAILPGNLLAGLLRNLVAALLGGLVASFLGHLMARLEKTN